MSLYTFLSRARRALRRSPRYLAARVVDSARRRVERPWSKVAPRLFTTARLLRETDTRTIGELWDRQKRRPFFMSPSDRDAWAAAFERTFRDSRAAVLAAADAALRHEFDLLGSGPRDLGDRLPWHTDFKVGRTWEAEYASAIQYAELDRPTDVKVPWELSRCQHFTVLGQAYWLTGDERYAREFVNEVQDWIARNPWGHGVNWACAMDVALRAVSWTWGFYFMSDSAACAAPAFRGAFLRALYLHGEHVATHIERSDVNGNHYLCDAVGLVFLGSFFRSTAKGRQWLETGREMIAAEMFNQTSVDGVDFEKSTPY